METKKTLSLKYFPGEDSRAGWRKLRRLLSDKRSLQRLFTSQRNYISPKELAIIYAELGKPDAA